LNKPYNIQNTNICNGTLYFPFSFFKALLINEGETTRGERESGRTGIGAKRLMGRTGFGTKRSRFSCNQCLPPPTLWVQFPLRRVVLDTTLCDKVTVTCNLSVVFSNYSSFHHQSNWPFIHS